LRERKLMYRLTKYGDTCPNFSKNLSVFWTRSPATTPYKTKQNLP